MNCEIGNYGKKRACRILCHRPWFKWKEKRNHKQISADEAGFQPENRARGIPSTKDSDSPSVVTFNGNNWKSKYELK
jgi:hypothetical protein